MEEPLPVVRTSLFQHARKVPSTRSTGFKIVAKQVLKEAHSMVGWNYEVPSVEKSGMLEPSLDDASLVKKKIKRLAYADLYTELFRRGTPFSDLRSKLIKLSRKHGSNALTENDVLTLGSELRTYHPDWQSLMDERNASEAKEEE